MTGYLYGLFQGDGNFMTRSLVFNVCENESELIGVILEEMSPTGVVPKIHHPNDGRYRIYYHSTELVRQWRELGLKKEIPSYVLSSDEEASQYIAGLFDSDGSVWANGQIELTIKNQRVSDQIQLLLSEFGVATLNHRYAGRDVNRIHPDAMCNRRAFADLVYSRVRHKEARLSEHRTA